MFALHFGDSFDCFDLNIYTPFLRFGSADRVSAAFTSSSFAYLKEGVFHLYLRPHFCFGKYTRLHSSSSSNILTDMWLWLACL